MPSRNRSSNGWLTDHSQRIGHARRGGMESMDVDVALAGGVMHGRGCLLLDTVTAQVTARYPKAHIRRVNVPPVVGAVLLAYDALHVTPPDVEQLKLPAQTLIASLPS
jgi:hypothetical protein